MLVTNHSEQAARDASFVKFQSRLSRFNWTRPGVQVTQEPSASYGQVERFIVIHTQFLETLYQAANRAAPSLRPIILAAIAPLPCLRRVRENGTDLLQYKLVGGSLAIPELVAVSDIDCLIGRYTTTTQPLRSYIVDRHTVVGRIDAADDMLDPNDWDVPPDDV